MTSIHKIDGIHARFQPIPGCLTKRIVSTAQAPIE